MNEREARIQIFCIDNQSLQREGLHALICSQPDMTIIGEASTLAEAAEAIGIQRSDVVLIDMQFSDGNCIAAIRRIRSAFAPARVIALSHFEGDLHVARVLQAGASAYLLKSAPPQEVLDAIRAVMMGRRYVSAPAAAASVRNANTRNLTSREMEVLRHAAGGDACKRIAAKLSISADTVRSHLKSVRSKLRANSCTHAVAIAYQRGILDP